VFEVVCRLCVHAKKPHARRFHQTCCTRSHAGIALFAVLAGIGRWLELRLPPPAPRLTGVLWTSSLLVIGFLLLFYHET
jgi:hypothetical protein